MCFIILSSTNQRLGIVNRHLDMKHLLAILLAGYFLCGMPLPGICAGQAAEIPWEEIKDSDGIKVFTANLPDQSILMVKTRTVIDADLLRIENILNDEERRVTWVPYLTESRRLHTFSPADSLQYNRFDAPWPAADRDIVFRVIRAPQGDNNVTYLMKSEDSPLMPQQKRIVRALLLESTYTLTAVNEHQTQVELVFHAYPQGWVPLWIVNIIQRAFPFLVLKNLRAQASGLPSG